MIEHDTEITKMFLQNTALIIDDGLYNQKGEEPERQILRIRNELEEIGMNFVAFYDIPNENNWDGLCNLSFAILDWNLTDHQLEELGTGIATAGALQADIQEQLISFIDYLINHTLMPVFIFTREAPDTVKLILQQNEKIKDAYNRNQIKVYSKDYISKKTIENVLEIWCRENPSIYVMKKLEGSLESARISLFQEMLQNSYNWPSVVVTSIERDGITEIDRDLTDFVMTSLLARTNTPHYESSILKHTKGKINDEEIIKLYSNSKFEGYDQQPTEARTGDVYVDAKGKQFWINITPECSLRDEKYIFLYGRATNNYEYDSRYGIIQKSTAHSIPMLLEHAVVEFVFKSYTVIEQEELNQIDFVSIHDKDKKERFTRKGRLLHPYITEIQERFGHYICRHGNIRHPDMILEKNKKKEKGTTS